MVALTSWDYRQAFDMGDSYFNRYDDSDMPSGQYLMLRSSTTPQAEIYRRWTLTAGQYQRFHLSYKIGTYSQRRGQCQITVQHLVGELWYGSLNQVCWGTIQATSGIRKVWMTR